jgi:hypothetical protein
MDQQIGPREAAWRHMEGRRRLRDPLAIPARDNGLTIDYNPIAQTCADLANKMIEANHGKPIPALDPYMVAMEQLGCRSFKK